MVAVKAGLIPLAPARSTMAKRMDTLGVRTLIYTDIAPTA